MSRVQIGATVKIRPTIMTRYLGSVGQIIQVIPNVRGIMTLDKYVVEFTDGERKTFWDIQIEQTALTEQNPDCL